MEGEYCTFLGALDTEGSLRMDRWGEGVLTNGEEEEEEEGPAGLEGPDEIWVPRLGSGPGSDTVEEEVEGRSRFLGVGIGRFGVEEAVGSPR